MGISVKQIVTCGRKLNEKPSNDQMIHTMIREVETKIAKCGARIERSHVLHTNDGAQQILQMIE